MYLPEKKAEEFFQKNIMPGKGEKIIVGFSGGADSVALLRVLLALRKKYGWKLFAVHVEHGIRGEAALADADWAQKLCEKLHVPLRIFHEDIPAYAKANQLTEEEAGRLIRYQRFYEVLKEENAVYIAVAHNADDNAETMLLSLARGTGLDGLVGIPPVRERIIRPLIHVQREEIEAYLTKLQQDWREDATNGLDVYARNRIRHHVMPQMKQVNSGAVEHMAHASEILAEAAELVGRQADVLLEKMEIAPEESPEKLTEDVGRVEGVLDLRLAEESSSLLRREVLHRWISKTANRGKDITAAHIYRLEDLLFGQAGRQADLPYGLTAVRGYETLQLLKRVEDTEEAGREGKTFVSGSGGTEGTIPLGLSAGDRGELSLGNSRFIYQIKEAAGPACYSQNTYTKSFDYDKLKCDLRLRYRRSGDTITVTKDGNHQSLKKYFINTKIPKGLRDSIPVFACGEEILWVVGGRIAEDVKVDDSTRIILEIQEKENE